MITHKVILLIYTLVSHQVSGIAIVSQLDHTSAYGSALDVLGPKVITSGIDADDNNANSNCYASIGSFAGFDDESVMDSPTMCLDVKLFESSSLLPDGVVTAMDNKQPMLLALNYKSLPASSQKPNLSAIINLPNSRFPATMTADKDEGGVYVALHDTNGILTWNAQSYSSGNDVRATWNYLRQMTYPNTLGTNIQSPIIYKYNIVDETEAWQTPLLTSEGKTMITAMEQVSSRDLLVVVGSTTGYGMTIGAGERSGGDWDGFITIVNTDTGSIDSQQIGTYNTHSARIKSQREKDDLVLGLCMDDDKAYLVGSTSGKIEGTIVGGAFVMKIDIDTLDIIWKKQIVGEGIEATHCDIELDTLYVGGTVPADKHLDYSSTKYGTNTIDIFAAVYDANSGDLKTTQQIDSHRDDELVGMEIHPGSGDVYITANAWDFASGNANMYILSMDTQGRHPWQNLAVGEDPITGEISSQESQIDGHSNPTEDPKAESGNISHGDGSPRSSKGSKGKIITVSIILSIAFSVSLLVSYRFYYRRKIKMSQKPVDGARNPTGDDAFPIRNPPREIA